MCLNVLIIQLYGLDGVLECVFEVLQLLECNTTAPEEPTVLAQPYRFGVAVQSTDVVASFHSLIAIEAPEHALLRSIALLVLLYTHLALHVYVHRGILIIHMSLDTV